MVSRAKMTKSTLVPLSEVFKNRPVATLANCPPPPPPPARDLSFEESRSPSDKSVSKAHRELAIFIKANFPPPPPGQTPPRFPPNLFNVTPTPSPSPTKHHTSPVPPPLSQIPSIRSERSAVRNSWPESFRVAKGSTLPVPDNVAEFGGLPFTKSANESGTDWMEKSMASWDSKLNLSFLPINSDVVKTDRASKRSSVSSVSSRVLAFLEPPVDGPATKPTLPPLSVVLNDIQNQIDADAGLLGSPASQTLSLKLNRLSISNKSINNSISTGETLVDVSQDRISLPPIQKFLDTPKSLNESLPPISTIFDSIKSDDSLDLSPVLSKAKSLIPPPTLIMPKSENVVDTWSQIINDDGEEPQRKDDDEEQEGESTINLIYNEVLIVVSDGACICIHCRPLEGKSVEWLEREV